MRSLTIRKQLLGWTLLACLALGGVGHAFAPPGQYGFFSDSHTVITDQKTHLTWERKLSKGLVQFSAAVTHCNALVLEGQGGWRLPTVKELLTLVDETPRFVLDGFSVTYPAVDSNAFPTPIGNFWTASQPHGSPDVMVVHFGTGVTATRNVTGDVAHVRCVKNAL